MPVTKSGPRAIRDEVVKEKMGKSTDKWDAILDKWSREENGHTKTAAYLAKEFGLSGWWA
ncbi:MAG: hypothetical protein CO189_04960 [candidate division Zixibacteria bacterium CG_4_9_14_3_um_filter_46_8]|nr:MAG: hypothetical protein CO189_04960 [candidate division Zixibacteria bacterium CG_4_9_14_3_um_filter_46_8]